MISFFYKTNFKTTKVIKICINTYNYNKIQKDKEVNNGHRTKDAPNSGRGRQRVKMREPYS